MESLLRFMGLQQIRNEIRWKYFALLRSLSAKYICPKVGHKINKLSFRILGMRNCDRCGQKNLPKTQ